MKIVLKLVVLTVMMLSFAFVHRASAATLGDTLAAKFCSNSAKSSYTLSTSDVAQWVGLEVDGLYLVTVNGVRYVAKFTKGKMQDSTAICTKTKLAEDSKVCSKWRVSKNGRVLIKDGSAVPCN